MIAHATRRLAAIAGIVGLAILSGATPAGAHAGEQSYVYLDVGDGTLGGRLEIPIVDLETALGFDLSGSDEEQVATLKARKAELDQYFEEHLKLGFDGDDKTLTFGEASLFYSNLAENDSNYVVMNFTAAVDAETVPRQLDVTFDPFFDEIEGRDALLLIGNDWKGGVIDNSHEVFVRFSADNRTQEVDLGGTGWTKTFLASIKLGLNHIRTGPDHILFILVLVLPSVLVFSEAWRPAKSFKSSLWRVTKVVSVFTLAHTITFSLAGLGLLPLPPSKFTEAVIAISIAAAALHNLRPLLISREWIIAFAFGLFHGMGFAGLVEDLEVSRATQLWSLLGRNVGIEIGQTLVVLLVFPALFLLRRLRYYRPIFVSASVAMIVVSLGWMLERVFELDLGVGAAVDPLVQFPRIVYALVALTLVALLVNRREEQQGRLQPVYVGEEV